jgi:hypothetical protein
MSAFHPIIVPELKLGHIERHVFTADLVEGADHTALKDRPEAFNGLSVDCADDVLPLGVVNDGMGIVGIKTAIADPLIRAKQADLGRDSFIHKIDKGRSADVLDYTTDSISLPTDSANNRGLTGTYAASSMAPASLVPMPVLGKTADESLIHLDNAAKFFGSFDKGSPDPVCHVPGSFEGAEAHVAPKLACADPLLAGEHQVNDTKPVAQRLIRILEDGPGDMGEAVSAPLAAIWALPMPSAGLEIVNPVAAATWAADTVRPSLSNKVGATGIFVREHPLKLRKCQLVNLLGLFRSNHDGLPIVGKTVS